MQLLHLCMRIEVVGTVAIPNCNCSCNRNVFAFLSAILDFFIRTEYKTRTFAALLEILNNFTGQQIRNVAVSLQACIHWYLELGGTGFPPVAPFVLTATERRVFHYFFFI